MSMLSNIIANLKSIFAREPDYSATIARITELQAKRDKLRRKKKKFSHIQDEIDSLRATIVAGRPSRG